MHKAETWTLTLRGFQNDETLEVQREEPGYPTMISVPEKLGIPKSKLVKSTIGFGGKKVHWADSRALCGSDQIGSYIKHLQNQNIEVDCSKCLKAVADGLPDYYILEA